MKNWRLVFKLALGFGGVLLLAGIVAAICYGSLMQISEYAQSTIEIDEMVSMLADCRRAEKDFRIYGFTVLEGAASSEDQIFRQAADELKNHIVELKESDAQLEQRLVRAEEDFDIYVAAFADQVEARRNKDEAFATWSRLGWNITDSIDRALAEVILPAQTTAQQTQSFKDLERWAGVESTLHTKVLEPFFLLRVNAVYLIATDADKEWEAYQKQWIAARAGAETWKSQVRGNALLTAAADEILGYLDEYSRAGDQYHSAILIERQADQTLDDAAAKLIDTANELRQKQVEDMRNVQDSALAWAATAMLLMLGLGTVLAWFITNSITVPMHILQDVSEHISNGDVQVSIEIRQKDEVGQLADAFRAMVSYLQTMADAAGKLSQGDLAVQVKPKSERDVLGNSFASMVAYQQEMASAADRLAQGDLTVNVKSLSSRDMLGTAVAQMITNLRALVGQVQMSASQVASASQQITDAAEQSAYATNQVAGTIQQIAQGTAQQTARVIQAVDVVNQVSRAIEGVARGAQEQASAVTESAAYTSKISQTIEQVTANAEAGRESAVVATETAVAGARQIEDTIRGMQMIREKVGISAEKVREMGKRSAKIGSIVRTIEAIAAQTNLLALNAAIEAARAGTHGKGFAVVADHVRKLAEDAASATQEIVVLVEEIQDTVSEAVQAMNEGAQEVESGVSRAGQSVRALTDILAAMDHVKQQVTGIAAASRQMQLSSTEMVRAIDGVSAVVEENTAATEEMAAGATQVSSSVEEIAGISEENAAATEQVSASVEEVSAQAEEVTASAQLLSEMAQSLQALVVKFKLPREY